MRINASAELQSAIGRASAMARYYGPSHQRTKAAQLAMVRARLADAQARVDRLAAEAEAAERELARATASPAYPAPLRVGARRS